MMAAVLRESSATVGAFYPQSERVAAIVDNARTGAARFLGGSSENIVFGTNMTSVNFTLTRTASRNFNPGDEIVVDASESGARHPAMPASTTVSDWLTPRDPRHPGGQPQAGKELPPHLLSSCSDLIARPSTALAKRTGASE